MLEPDGTPSLIDVPIGDRRVFARLMRLAVGRVHILMLDADIPANHPHDREITAALYGGGHDGRIRQEILLGIGGVRALRKVGQRPAVYHLNEGHCAFAALELARELTTTGRDWREALDDVRKQLVFTTHTPVSAGHDRFGWREVNEALGAYRAEVGVPKGAFMDLGRVYPGDLQEPLCMTVIALRCSSFSNGVSALHGRVSRAMWHSMWPELPETEVPIGHVTNGVHPTFWMSVAARRLFDTYVPGWREDVWSEERWREGVAAIPDAALWELRGKLRRRLIAAVRRATGCELDPDGLTLGFARRFAPYKRGNLIFTDTERAHALLARGAQLVYAGKAHPADRAGQEIVTEVLQRSASRAFHNRIAFLPDYDIRSGQLITSGSDVWLNNPRRPKEASGTSGQKVPLNGGINLSVLDGWWAEGFTGDNGWVIGDESEHNDLSIRDAADAESLYTTLEEVVLPLWQDRDARGIPVGWVRTMRASIASNAPRFTSHRMVRDYVLGAYEPLAR